jgi:hypothetical protein
MNILNMNNKNTKEQRQDSPKRDNDYYGEKVTHSNCVELSEQKL